MVIDFEVSVPREALLHAEEMHSNLTMLLGWMQGKQEGLGELQWLQRMDVRYRICDDNGVDIPLHITWRKHNQNTTVTMACRQVGCYGTMPFEEYLRKLYFKAVDSVLDGAKRIILPSCRDWSESFECVEFYEEDGMCGLAVNEVSHMVYHMRNQKIRGPWPKYILMPTFLDSEPGSVMRAMTSVLMDHGIVLRPAYRMWAGETEIL